MNDRRHFRRCPRVSTLDLRYKNRSYKAKTFDYSFNGLGAIVEDALLVESGDVFEVAISAPEIRTYGEVMWVSNGKTGLKIGLRHVGTLKGLIRDFRLADILIGLQRSNQTGILTVNKHDIEKKVYISNGDLVFSYSNQVEDRLANLLLKENMITLDQYNHSVSEMKKTGQRQGTVLVKLGYLTPNELVTVVKHQAEEIILGLFALDDGFFVFEEKPLPTEEVITLKLSAANLIYNGTKKITNFSRIRSELPSTDSVLCFASDPYDLFQDIKLDAMGKRIISSIDGKKSIKEVFAAGPPESFESLKTVYALLNTRMVEIKDDCVANSTSENIIGEAGEQEIGPQLKEVIEDMHLRYKSLGYYGVLGIKAHASATEFRSAYYRAAKMYHPDRHFSFADDSLKAKLSDIFSYVYEAYATLSNPLKREEYDKSEANKPARPVSNRDRAAAAFEDGKKQLERNKYPDAELLFGKTIYYDNTVAEYHYYYALSLTKQNKFREAAKAMEKALNLAPVNADYLAELGFVFLELEFNARARGMFDKAVKTSPHHERALRGLKIVNSLLG